VTKNERNELVVLDEIYAELRKDAREISRLLVKGVRFHWTIGFTSLIWISILVYSLLLIPILPYSPTIRWILITVDVIVLIFYVYSAVRYFHRYFDLKRKYSKLIELEKALGE